MDNVEKVIEALKPLADKIGQGAKFLYGVFYRQTLVEGILQLVLCFIAMIVVAVITLKVAKYMIAERQKRAEYIKKHDRYGWEENGWTGALCGLLGGTLVVYSILIPVFAQGALKVGNPQYYTIQRIITSAQNKELR